MPTNFALIKQFHAVFDPVNEHGEPLDKLLARRVAYLTSETEETVEAADELLNAADAASAKIAKAHLVKELIEVIQVSYGFLHLLQVDADAAYAEVHRSNMSKTPNPGGKAIKGEGYQPAQMEQFV